MKAHISKSFNQLATYFTMGNTFGITRADDQVRNLKILTIAGLRPGSLGVWTQLRTFRSNPLPFIITVTLHWFIQQGGH
jgi:hypothetical protein